MGLRYLSSEHRGTGSRRFPGRNGGQLLSPSIVVVAFLTLYCHCAVVVADLNGSSKQQQQQQATNSSIVFSDENFTFARNGSFIQLDAGREWPFNSKREISFRFKTKSHHGLLIYQTFDHNKLVRDDDQDNLDLMPPSPPMAGGGGGGGGGGQTVQASKQAPEMKQSSVRQLTVDGPLVIMNSNSRRLTKRKPQPTPSEHSNVMVKQLRGRSTNHRHADDLLNALDAPLAKLSSSAITATASEKLVNSLFSSSPAAAINGNQPSLPRGPIASMVGSRADVSSLLSSANGGGGAGSVNIVSAIDPNSPARNRRVLSSPFALGSEASLNNRLSYNGRGANVVVDTTSDGSTILSSSTISSFSASLYELYLKLENGRLKIMYEFGSRLNQTYCGKGLNDDRWHRIDLKVDPELNQMVLILDQVITVEIALSQAQHEEEALRRNELVFTNSVLYLGGLDNNASIVRNLRQRLYMAQFIGCIGQIMLKNDQHTETNLQPVAIDRMVLVRRGCLNKCDTDNYCLHKSTCVNHYTHTKCDCFGTHYEDVYCWQDKLTTLSMLGYSTLVHRIYNWRDRHHSNINRLSLQFKTLAFDSVLFFAYGDSSAQQSPRNFINPMAQSYQQQQQQAGGSTLVQAQSSSSSSSLAIPTSQVNLSNLNTIHRPIMTHQSPGNTNHLAVSLSNGTIVVEVNFGDQPPVLLSNLLYDKVYNRTAHSSPTETGPTSNNYRPLSLSDGRWHNVTFIHNNKQLSLHVDNYSINYTILGKNHHLYFDPSVYVGGVPNLLLNETRLTLRPFNLRHKFVGCLRSVYFNQHNILLALKQGSPMVDYRDPLGKPRLDSCLVQEPSSLPLTMRSGKSYLTFQLTPNSQFSMLSAASPSASSLVKSSEGSPVSGGGEQAAKNNNNTSGGGKFKTNSTNSTTVGPIKKLTRIEFEYKTSLASYFLAGGHLRDLSYHDLGGFWTLHAQEGCQLYFTISSGLTFEPEQVIKLNSNISEHNNSNSTTTDCDSRSWFKISISIISGDKVLNVTRSKVSTVHQFDDEYLSSSAHQQSSGEQEDGAGHLQHSYILRSSVELLHQVQLGGDLAKFGESSSVPFTGCMRRIRINGHLFDSRDFVTTTNSAASSMSPLPTTITAATITTNLNQQQQQQPNASNNRTTSSSSAALPLGTTQSDVISSRMTQGHVTLDSCQLVNPCASLNPCKNNGVCKINELGEPECDCSKTGYTGKRCHFSIYKQSCQDLFLSGQRKSSYYLIDLDRNGPLRPVRVRCNMDEGSVGHIETVLTHNLPAEYLIRRSLNKDIVLDITYLAFHHMYTADGFYLHDDRDEKARLNQDAVLRSLIGQSIYCRQHFRYECRSAPLELGNKTWMEAPYPKTHRLTSLDGVNHGKCMCATTEKKCLDPAKSCNCDSNEPIWADDSYDLIGHEDVGLTRIVILKQDTNKDEGSEQSQLQNSDQKLLLLTSRTESHARFTLSDLKCYGTEQYESQHEITFKTNDAYIEIPGWRRGDISFSFRTASNAPAIILYQLATSRNHGYFRLTLISDTRLLFEFILNRKPRKIFLTSTHKLNNGEWQQVFIEYDLANLRLTVNDDSAMVDLDTNDYLGTFEGPLFIGGAPSKYLVGDLSKRNGFTGCFRGLNIDGRSIDLKSYLSPSMPSVTSGCRPSCTKNLCQNGGKCIEYWGSYECECSNPIAHSGSNCEINLNTNSITFVTQESYYVQLSNDSLLYPPYLIKNILLNIRTYQETALILYASDHLNNFIQLHKNGSSLVLTFNSNSTIVIAQVPIAEEVNSVDLVGGTKQPASVAAFMPPPSIENNLVNLAAPTANPENTTQQQQQQSSSAAAAGFNSSSATTNLNTHKPASSANNSSSSSYSLMDRFIRVSNTSGSGQPIQVKIERHRLRTTFYVNSNFVVVEKPMIFLANYTQNPWLNPELESVRPPRPKIGSKTYSQIFLANIDDYFATRLPGFTGCIQGLSIDNQLFDFNRVHLTGELKGEYKIGCKMHCDSFPCKNHGTCIENWKKDGIQCKCDTTSYVGRLCDEDIAAIFNGQSSYFLYHLSRKFALQSSSATRKQQQTPGATATTASKQNSYETAFKSMLTINLNVSSTLLNDEPTLIVQSSNELINFFEISLAFSTDANQQAVSSRPTGSKNSAQVLVLITRANTSKYFFLGLTPDGSLLIQEDYGGSMSLSRLIKKPEHPYNDGHRHMVKYSRYNQTIQIVVDYQTYLPTMSVITSNHVNKYSKTSVILVGTVGDGVRLLEDTNLDSNYTNYNGCISNLLIKMDDLVIEPLSEAFGQNIETVNIPNYTQRPSSSQTAESSLNQMPDQTREDSDKRSSLSAALQLAGEAMNPQDGFALRSALDEQHLASSQSTKTLSIINKLSGKEVIDDMETIVARDVEQGKCAAFKRVEIVNEKRSVNEPKYTPLLEPRPVYMDPPRIKPYNRTDAVQAKNCVLNYFNPIFYCSLTILALVGSSTLVYAYILQVRYKSEKFRCETPFFHKRDEAGNEIVNAN